MIYIGFVIISIKYFCSRFVFIAKDYSHFNSDKMVLDFEFDYFFLNLFSFIHGYLQC